MRRLYGNEKGNKGIKLFILDKKSKQPLYMQLYEQIKNDIISGRIKNREKLESSRMLAQNMNISRNTVELAYEKLISEGFAVNYPRKGYFVQYSSDIGERCMPVSDDKRIIYDMRRDCMRINKQMLFKWKQCMAKALDDCSIYSPDTKAKTDMELKIQICDFLYKHRKINCEIEDIILFGTEENCLAALFDMTGKDNIDFSSCGSRDLASKLCGEESKAKKYIYEYIKPFEKKTPMSVKERKNAASSGSFIIENDRGFLFFKEHIRLPAIRAYNENVIYIGTFSDILLPITQISYMLLPEKIKKKMNMTEKYYAATDETAKKTLTYFMKEKNRERYFYRIAKEEKEKADIITGIFSEISDERINVNTGDGTITIKTEEADKKAAESAERGIMTEYDESGIILCVRGLTKDEVREAAFKLYPLISNSLLNKRHKSE